MTILTEPETIFAEPWEAQAFALAVKLSEQGYFTWKEWSAALAEEIKSADRPYYHQWLAALERLVSTRVYSPGRNAQAQRSLGERLSPHPPRQTRHIKCGLNAGQ